ncbi:MAG: sodium-dependent bicarbonate transport family permease [Bacteroidia bacterium]
MDFQLIITNFLNIPILFFFLGVLAVLLKSDLEIPQPLPKLFSIYLLFAIGLKGGMALSSTTAGNEIFYAIIAAIAMSLIVPLVAFYILRFKTDIYNAAALAAAFGSVSVVTFITATSYLQKLGITYDGYMVALLAIMESPAIVIGIMMVRMTDKSTRELDVSFGRIIKEAFLNGSVFLLIGSLFIGAIAGKETGDELQPFIGDIFKGILALFLLDMGIISARRIKELRIAGGFLVAFSIILPLVTAAAGMVISYLIGMGEGNALLFTVLCASASYIAVPAAIRTAIPQANPGYYVPLPLGITFPFNIIIGIPLYYYLINLFWN